MLSQEMQHSGHTLQKQSSTHLHFSWMQYSYLFPIHQRTRAAECFATASGYSQGLFHLQNCHTYQQLDRVDHLEGNNVIDPSQGTSPHELPSLHLCKWMYFINCSLSFSCPISFDPGWQLRLQNIHLHGHQRPHLSKGHTISRQLQRKMTSL